MCDYDSGEGTVFCLIIGIVGVLSLAFFCCMSRWPGITALVTFSAFVGSILWSWYSPANRKEARRQQTLQDEHDKILDLLESGVCRTEIVKTLGCSEDAVDVIWYLWFESDHALALEEELCGE